MHDPRAHRRIDDRRRRVGAHAAGIRSLVAVEGALVVLRRGERQRRHAIAKRKERRLLAGEKFLDYDLAGGLAQTAAEHHVDRRVRGGEVFGDDHALAGGKPVGLDHDRRAALADIGLSRFGGAETLVGGGGDAVCAAQILGESPWSPRAGRRRGSARTP